MTFTRKNLLDFLRSLTIPPDVVQKSGGMDKLMAEHGVRTIWVNEYDLSIINAMRQDREANGRSPQMVDELENSLGQEWGDEHEQSVDIADELNPNDELLAVLARLATTLDEDLYLMAVRQAIACSETFKSRKRSDSLSASCGVAGGTCRR